MQYMCVIYLCYNAIMFSLQNLENVIHKSYNTAGIVKTHVHAQPTY